MTSKSTSAIWNRASRAALACARAICLVSLLATQGCTIFSSKPPLPKRASIEHGAQPTAETDYAALVGQADIIYFPRERAASGARSEPAALLLEALQQPGQPFAIAWDVIDATQQPLLDQLPGAAERIRENAIGQLEPAGSGRAREHCRAVLRDPRFTQTRHFALGLPRALIAKFRASENLTPEEQQQLPNGFTPPAGGFEALAERLASARGVHHRAAAGIYRAQLASQQYAAEQIVRYFRSGAASGRLLVFLRGEDLAAGAGVPYYVAQKINVRQLVLDSNATRGAPAQLLTWTPPGPPGFKVTEHGTNSDRE